MKSIPFFLAILLALSANAQDPILAANKCYEEKNYECAVGKYKEALADKKYQEKDLSTIHFRIGYGLGELKKYEEAIAPLRAAIETKPDMRDAIWSLAWSYHNMEEYELAEDYYLKAIELYKDERDNLKSLYYWRGVNAVKLYEDEMALDYFARAREIDSTNSNYYSYSGEASYNLGKYADAIYFYKKAISIGKGEPKPTAARYYWIGQSHSSLYQYNEALEAYKKGLEFNAENKNIPWGMAAAYYNLSKWPDAITHYTKALAAFKDDTASMKSIYYWRGRSYYNLKDYNKSLTDLEEALKLDPNYRESIWQKAQVLYQQKKYKEAIAFFDRSIDLYKGATTSLDDLHYFRGHSYLLMKDTAKAEKDFLESLKNNANLIDPNVYMGHLSYARKNYSTARTYYGKAVNYTTDSATLSDFWFKKGFSNLQSGDAYKYTAKEDILKSIKYDSTNKEAHRYAADLHYSGSNFALAEKSLDKCITLYSKVKDSLPVMYKYRALARWQQKKYKEAVDDYEQADKLKPFKTAEDVKSIGQLSFEIKDYERANKYFTRLLSMYKPEQKNELVFVYFARGRTYLELKKKDQAVKDLKKSLELSPGNQEILPWLTKAESL